MHVEEKKTNEENRGITVNEKFIEKLINVFIIEGIEEYKIFHETLQIGPKTINYWKDVKQLYSTFNQKQKEIYYEIIRQVMIDTISCVFGILDGTTSMNGMECNINVEINGCSTEHELQDIFLEKIEERLEEMGMDTLYQSSQE